MKKIRKRALVATATGIAALAAGQGMASAAPAQTVRGQVTCVSGNNVVGVWVTAANGGSGWASRRSLNGSTAYWSYRLPNGGSYKVTVGCGGTPQRWGSSNNSNYTSGNASFMCYDTAFAYYARNFCQQA